LKIQLYFNVLQALDDHVWIAVPFMLIFAPLLATLLWLVGKFNWRIWFVSALTLVIALGLGVWKVYAVNEQPTATAGDMVGVIGWLFVIAPAVLLAVLASLVVLLIRLRRPGLKG
jgi:hypothetical protein